MKIKRLAIIGVGLIGGSLALALRRAGVVGEIVGAGRGTANLETARQLGVIDRYTTDAREAVTDADMVVVAAALGATDSIFSAISPALSATAVITDVGSSKGNVIRAARANLGANFPRFVPGHPIAGTERSGATAAFADLFRAHKVILTPLDDTEPTACAQVRAMWEASEATVVEMNAAAHDRALAATSHLPHLLAYNLVDALAQRADASEIFEFAAGGFRDFTRIASSNPQMWSEIALANKAALIDACRDYAARFDELIAALEVGDGAALQLVFRRAQAARERCIVPESNEPA